MYLKSEVYRNDLEQAIRGTVDFEKLFHKRILVTGATGMIGSFITDMLLHANRTAGAGVEVYALARSREQLMLRFCSSQSEKNLRFRIQDVTEPLQADICADYIIHAAGDGFPAAFRKHPVETMTPALLGTCQLLQYAREHPVEKFLYISSGEVYGKSSGTDHAFHEEEGGLLDSMDVRNCYPVSKRCGHCVLLLPPSIMCLRRWSGSAMCMGHVRLPMITGRWDSFCKMPLPEKRLSCIAPGNNCGVIPMWPTVLRAFSQRCSTAFLEKHTMWQIKIQSLQ